MDRCWYHDDVIKWRHFPRYWPFVRGIHRSPVNSLHKGQWRGDLMFSLICARINGWINNGEAGDLRRYRAHYDVTVMFCYHTNIIPGLNNCHTAGLVSSMPYHAYGTWKLKTLDSFLTMYISVQSKIRLTKIFWEYINIIFKCYRIEEHV